MARAKNTVAIRLEIIRAPCSTPRIANDHKGGLSSTPYSRFGGVRGTTGGRWIFSSGLPPESVFRRTGRIEGLWRVVRRKSAIGNGQHPILDGFSYYSKVSSSVFSSSRSCPRSLTYRGYRRTDYKHNLWLAHSVFCISWSRASSAVGRAGP
jgi:hypothetical protein